MNPLVLNLVETLIYYVTHSWVNRVTSTSSRPTPSKGDMPTAPAAVEDPGTAPPAPPTSKEEEGDEETGEASSSSTSEGKDNLRRCGCGGGGDCLRWLLPSSAATSLSLRRLSMACCRRNRKLSTRRCLAPGLKLEPMRSLGPRPRLFVAFAEAASFVGPSWLSACGNSPNEIILRQEITESPIRLSR